MSDLARLDEDRTLLAVFGAVVAIASAGVLVFMAARVLEVRRPSMASLRRTERQDGASGQDPFEDPSSEFGRYVVEHRNELLGPGRASLEALERDRNAVFNALFRGRQVSVLGQAFDPQNDAHATRLAILEADIEGRISRLQDAAELFETSRRYSMLLRSLGACSLPFIVGVGVFIYVTATAPESTPVRSPTPMTLRAPAAPGDLQALGLSPSCAGKHSKPLRWEALSRSPSSLRRRRDPAGPP